MCLDRYSDIYLLCVIPQLPFHCQWQDLKDLFRQAGSVLRADVSLRPDGRSRGFGTVSFATEADAERAVQLFNGWVFLAIMTRHMIYFIFGYELKY